MTIREQLEQRAATRARCRKEADAIIKHILTALDDCPEELHGQILSMVMAELQIATRKESK